MHTFSHRSCCLGITVWLLAHATYAASAAAGSSTLNPANALSFNGANYSALTVTIDGARVPVRWYQEICYVATPVAVAAMQSGVFGPAAPIADPRCGYQSMNVFVPESAVNDQQTALYFAVNNGGWMASHLRASVADGASFDSASSHVGAVLKAGYVFIDVATRSRGLVAADGTFPGKSPAAVVDAKAAVRYLRQNDAAMPGSAERIVVNGTSGGGALAAILGAAGNSRDYLPLLAAVGAAGIDARGRSNLRDDVFAVNAYCPITDLGNADLAYEWLYTALGTRQAVGSDPDPKASAEIAAKFAAYQRKLRLSNATGEPLTAANMLAEIQHEVRRSAEVYWQSSPGNAIPDLGEEIRYNVGGMRGTPIQARSYTNDWIDVDHAARKVLSIDIQRYLKFVATQATLKAVPAFDPTGLSIFKGQGGESNLFGARDQKYTNFTEFSWNHNDAGGDGVGKDDTARSWAEQVGDTASLLADQLKMIDPMAYIGTAADTAPNWYLRHGTRDRDTAFTVSINLHRALAADKSVRQLDYRLSWNVAHAGNYDVPEVMRWIASVLESARGQRNRR